ncbi:hypothetical protein BDW22DRAFT_1432230 [Trametopsis cervina]|nr:hypothetical protein BDW22DRAFT_1432230 [Trametopsis cervina]
MPQHAMHNSRTHSASGLASSLQNLGITSATGSTLDGRPLSQLECAAHSSGTSSDSCSTLGNHLCSRCRLVKYCSKACQTAHWPTHKSDCKSQYLSPSWTTRWVQQRRKPAFITDGDEPPLSFGHGFRYVWGNLPAVDCINATANEGPLASSCDFNLAFVASGDLRNMMLTINSLPDDYTGKPRVLLNDRDVTVAGRNAAILFILLSDSDLEIEEAAELCLHLQYSAALTYKQATYLSSRLIVLFSDVDVSTCLKEIPLRGGGTLYLLMRDVQDIIDMLKSRYPLSRAISNMHAITLAPSREDYIDRYLLALKGPHRVGEMRMRETGVLLPFGSSTAHFTEPNRLLFNERGQWLCPDSASQLSGWDARAAIATGEKHQCTPEDVYGCLYFHVRDVFITFAKRARKTRLNIHVLNVDAMILPSLITEKLYTMKHFYPPAFDRVETSNVLDYVGPQAILGAWAPMLNRNNEHATLLLSSMNWALRQEGARAASMAGIRDSTKRTMDKCMEYLGVNSSMLSMSPSDPLLLRVMHSLEPFNDNEKPFREYINDSGLRHAVAQCGLAIKAENTILPKRIGYPLSKKVQSIPPFSKEEWYQLYCLGRANGTERFLELKVA